jgi:hypothetical protein
VTLTHCLDARYFRRIRSRVHALATTYGAHVTTNPLDMFHVLPFGVGQKTGFGSR